MKKNILVIAAVLALAAGTPAVAGAKAKPVSLNTAAKKYVAKANSAANKKSGKTKLKVVIKGKVKWSELGKAVSAIHCKNVRKNTEKAFRDEVLCRTWSIFTIEKKGKNTVIDTTFNNKQMRKYSSYGKVNYIERAEKSVDKYLNIFKGVFSKKMGKAQLGAFAVGYVSEVAGNGNGAVKYKGDCKVSCARGVASATHEGNNCAGRLDATTRVMRMLGFKKKECGGVFNYATNHGWNWWKDEKGTVYFGDAGKGRGIKAVERETGEEYWFNTSAWEMVVKNNYDRPVESWVEDLGYESIDAAKERAEELIAMCVGGQDIDGKADKELDVICYCDFKTFNKYVEIKGFYLITRAEVAKNVKTGKSEWGASDGPNGTGTKWKLSQLDFVY